nr:glycosyltransferase family 4 protein [Cerasicoccus arenae]
MHIDYFFNDDVLDSIRSINNSFKPSVVLIEYVFFSRAFSAFPSSVHRVIDTHDIFSDRHKSFLKAGLIPEWFFTTKTEERKGIGRANSVLAIQGWEAKKLNEIGKGKAAIYTVGHLAEPNPLPPPAGLNSILFLGSDNSINRQALDWFLNRVWPKVHQSSPSILLKVGGSISKNVRPAEQVVSLGHVDSLMEAYAACDLVINPAQTGSGLSIKSVEALSYARPLLTTTIGAQGLPDSGRDEAYLVVDSAQEMANKITHLANSYDEIPKIANTARLLYHNYYNNSIAQLRRALERS